MGQRQDGWVGAGRDLPASNEGGSLEAMQRGIGSWGGGYSGDPGRRNGSAAAPSASRIQYGGGKSGWGTGEWVEEQMARNIVSWVGRQSAQRGGTVCQSVPGV